MESDSTINVPVKVRTHELNQAHDFIPRVAERLRAIDADPAQEQADELERIYAERIEGVEPDYSGNTDYIEFATYLSMPVDEWRTVVGGLARLRDEEGLRVNWLRKKLVQRLTERLEEMDD